MARRVYRGTKGKVVPNLIADTKTAAEHYARGYRNSKKRWGKPAKVRGTVKVEQIGGKWRVVDYS